MDWIGMMYKKIMMTATTTDVLDFVLDFVLWRCLDLKSVVTYVTGIKSGLRKTFRIPLTIYII